MSVLAAGERFVNGKTPDLDTVRNFLLLQHPSALGTAIHATPLIRALHATIPNVRVTAAASGFAAEILRNNPGLETVLTTPNPLSDLRGAVDAMRAHRPFRGEPFAVLQTTGNERSRVALAAILSGGRTRVGFTVVPELSVAPLYFDSHQSQIANNLRIIDALGHGPALHEALKADPDITEPQVFPTEAHMAMTRRLLLDEGIDGGKPIAVFITQTSLTQRKSWRAERFRAVAETLRAEAGMQVVFAGTRDEAAAIDELRSGLSFATASVAGRTGLLELSAMLRQADIALTLDTGPMHLARAVRLPVVILAPAWSPAIEWLPIGNSRARILKNAVLGSASPDYVIDEVSVEEVEQNLREMLSLYPPRQFSWRE